MFSGFEAVLLLLRGLTGSYSHRRPLSRHRSHCGRSSLHFFFFSLLHYRAISNTARSALNFPKRSNAPMNAACSHDRIAKVSHRSHRKMQAFVLDPNRLINQCNQDVQNRKKKKSAILLTGSRTALGYFCGNWTMWRAVKHRIYTLPVRAD